jgi:hypothetical protein
LVRFYLSGLPDFTKAENSSDFTRAENWDEGVSDFEVWVLFGLVCTRRARSDLRLVLAIVRVLFGLVMTRPSRYWAPLVWVLPSTVRVLPSSVRVPPVPIRELPLILRNMINST